MLALLHILVSGFLLPLPLFSLPIIPHDLCTIVYVCCCVGMQVTVEPFVSFFFSFVGLDLFASHGTARVFSFH